MTTTLLPLDSRRLPHILRSITGFILVASAIGYGAVGEAAEGSADAKFNDPFASMVFVKGNCYQMGDVFGDGEPDERPVHEVCVDDFYLGEHEVTQREWIALMGKNPSDFKHCGLDCPVENVSWEDAQEFIRRLNRKTARIYRLPTEAEWEYAAREGGKKLKWSGTNDEARLGEYAWYGDNAGEKTHPVKTRKPNALGLYDMTGNVIEWLSDQWGKRYYAVSPRSNPTGTDQGVGKGARGGSYRSDPMFSRAINRYHDEAELRSNNHGFRLALTAPGIESEAIADREALAKAADYIDPVTGIGFVKVKGSTFQMGDMFGDGHPNYERPVHEVTVSDFYIAQTEVTQEQWLKVAGYNPSKYRGGHLPVEQVSWKDIEEWLAELNEKSGQRFRLPTEAEWEYAARSGGKKEKWSGTNDMDRLGDYVWYKWNSNNRSHPVATKKPNGLGLYDMSGGVWEWVADRFDYFTAEAKTNPKGPERSMLNDYRAYRGGAWDYIPELVRTTMRSGKEPSYKRSWIGFRIAIDEPKQVAQPAPAD